ncbi:MAG: CDP-glycerol glycerophosphotransferase family protein [Coriobacteriia bacterium]|nr:CDP-glycerol glycerophosphotransferase family protein [Coriobacteriia bacterium]
MPGRETEAAFALVVDALEWERTRLRLHGTLVANGSGGTPDAAALTGSDVYLQEARSDRRARVGSVRVTGARFTLDVAVFFALDGDPLVTGTWLIRIVTPAGDVAPVRMSPDLTIPAYGYEGIRSVRGGRYWLFPVAERAGGRFALAVTYRKNRTAGGQGSLLSRLGARIRRRLRRTWELLFKSVYRICTRVVKRTGTRILFTSDSRATISGNLLDIRDRMRERGFEGEYTFWYLFKESTTARRPLADKLRLPFYLAAADVILLDDYHPTLYKVEFHPDVSIIQLWHASGAFKTVGYSRIGKPGGPNPFSHVHKNYTHAIVSSRHDVPFYAEAFGIDEKRVVPTGIPRMDVFFDAAYRERTAERMREQLPQTRGREVILFAPTFRGKGPSDAYYDHDRLDLQALHDLATERDAIVVFKMHPFVIEPLEIPAELTDRLVEASAIREVNDLLFIADLVITDYSSLVFEYCTLGRPMLFFAYDLEDYISTRDFYEGYEEFVPGRIVRTFGEMLDAIRAQDFEAERVAAFAERHLEHHDGHATDRIIDDLVLGRAGR